MNTLDYIYKLLHKHNPKLLIQIRLLRVCHEWMNWKNPKTINAKINWLKFHCDIQRWAYLSDKYAVRQYVEAQGLKEILVPLLGHWTDANKIEWEKLPKQFILKTNNGSGDSLIVTNKYDIDQEKVEKYFNKLLHNTYQTTRYEPHYSYIKPCIIAEQLLNASKQAFQSSSLIDYKIWCFDGKPYSIWVCSNRTKETVDVATYDLDWNFHPEFSVSTDHYRLQTNLLPRPKTLKTMLEAAAKLSKGFPCLRVDMYEVDGKVYFGELTFTSNGGMMDFYTHEYALELGQQINLPATND